MKNNEKQIARLDKQLTTNFQQELSKNKVDISYKEVITDLGWWGRETKYYLKQNNTKLNIEKLISDMIDCNYGDYKIKWKEATEFIHKINKINEERAIQTFQNTLNSTQNTYQNVINTMQNQFEENLQREQEKVASLQRKINTLQQQAEEFIKQQQTVHNNNRYLPSTDRVKLEQIKDKYKILEKITLTLEEKLQYTEEKNQEYEKTLEVCEESLINLEKNFQNADARWQEAEIKLGLAKAEIECLESTKEGLEEAQQRGWQRYLTEAYNVTKLTDLAIRYNDLILENEEILKEEVTRLEEKLNKTIGELKANKEDLTKINNLHWINKLKLSTVLTLDSTRTFMPQWYGKILTTIETTILISQISDNNKLENGMWTIILIFFVSSILHTSYKIVNLLKQRLLNWKDKIIKTLKSKRNNTYDNKIEENY